MKVILDTSVWIEYFKGNELFFEQCQKLIENGRILSVDVVFAELLQGALDAREVDIIKKYIEALEPVRIPDLVIKSGDYSRENKLLSKGIGLIDAIIIVSTINSDAVLWTLDKKIIKYLGDNYLYKY